MSLERQFSSDRSMYTAIKNDGKEIFSDKKISFEFPFHKVLNQLIFFEEEHPADWHKIKKIYLVKWLVNRQQKPSQNENY